MSKLRMLFVKEAQASYISHLDLMRTIQRAFPRTELDIKHTQGFHPHPILSIVLPLSVGQQSDCELLDFEVQQEHNGHGIVEKINTGLPAGLRVLDCYPAVRPIRELAFLQADIVLEYDNGVPQDALARLKELFARDTIIVQKKTKHRELADVNIAPMLHKVELTEGDRAIYGTVVVQAQNPGVNPALLEKAIERELPELKPDFMRVRRRRILDENGEDFR